MSDESFVHLHVHTEYSMLDGASKINELVEKVARDEQPAVAITDHGVLFGLVDFHKEARAAGVKPILGSELYQAHGSRRDQQRTPNGDRYYHLTALAADETGYRNLMALSTRAYLEGTWYKPRVDRELLSEHAEGLVVLSGCLGGEVNQALLRDDEPAALQALSDFRDILGPERFFVELMDHGIDEQGRTWPVLERMARDLGLRTVITNDSHYTDVGDAEAHDALLCIQTGSEISQENRFRFSGPEYYLRTAEEMWRLFGTRAPDALKATLDIAEMCDVELEFGQDLLPEFPTTGGRSEAEQLHDDVLEGAHRLYGSPLPGEVARRIEYELGVIEDMGFPAYFLIVADLCRHAREVGIRVGPGRGSAGGSVVAYATGITTVDPIRHGLIFERFLNPARKEMPDIDMDFDDRRRSEMIRYSAERYGDAQVAQVITFGTIKAKSAIRDAARVLGPDILGVDNTFQVGDQLCKMMPPAAQGKEWPLVEPRPDRQSAYDLSTELRQAREDPTHRRVLETAEKLEGLKRQHGIHAAAVIIGAKPLVETVPLLRTDNGETLTQYEMKACESLGLLKMDFLGLRNLTVIADAERHVRTNRGVEVRVDDPTWLGEMDDPDVYEMLATGHTLGVFQLDSTGMQALVRKLRPTRFEDISALLALYRPGPLSMDMHLTYADRKNGLEDVSYDHPDLEPILGDTYGVCVSGDTLVVDAQTGERIRVADAEGRTFLVQGAHGELGKVSHWVDNGVKEVVALTTRSGRRVTLTSDHRVLTPDGWRPAGELSPGDAVATPHRLDVDGSPGDPDVARVLGCLLADGSISTSSNVAFVNRDEELLDDFTDRVLRAFPACRVRRYERGRSVQLQVVDDGTGAHRRPSSLLQFLRDEGVQGTSSATKSVPASLFAGDDDTVAEFLAAYWDCDGHVAENFAHVETTSARLATDLQDLLLRLGIQSRVACHDQADRRHGVAYQVHVDDGDAFAQVRRRMRSAKREVSFEGSGGGGVFPRQVLLDAVAVSGLTQREVARRAGTSRKNLFRVDTPFVSERIARAVARGTGVELDLRDRWDPVVSVEHGGRERVYDLTVDDTHSFVADGVVVHNCVYQEQVMQIATDIAGFAMADADGLRKAVGKKKRDLMESFKGQFLEGGTDKGYDTSLMSDLWDLIEKFAEYGFNKAHTVAYGVISYQTAWLKTHYPVEYMAALLTSVKNHKDNKPIYLNECRRMGIPVLPPDVNVSEVDFTASGDEIRFGLSAVRGVGDGVVEAITSARDEGGPFEDFRDFCARVDGSVLKKGTLENLVLAGAFTGLGHTRKGLLGAYEPIVAAAQATKKARAAGQDSLFDGLGGDEPVVELDDGVEISDEEYGKQVLLKQEREMLGLYVSDHPLFGAERLLEEITDCSVAGLRERDDGAGVSVGGVLTGLTKKFTRKGDTYLVATLEDLTGSVEVVFWPAVFRAAHEALVEDAVLVVTGRVESRDEAVKLVANRVTEPDLSEVRGMPVEVRFDLDQCTPDALQRLRDVLGNHPGHVAVHLHVRCGGGERRWRLGDDLRVTRRPGLLGELKAAFGPDVVGVDGGRTFEAPRDR